jgi:2-desacetyl-2-hydroxyethyl bacteriochlorophyllide A dehydrogenase
MIVRVIKGGPGVTMAEGTVCFLMGSAHTGNYCRAWGAHMSHAVTGVDSLQVIPEGVDLVQAAASKMASIPYHGLLLCKPVAGEKIAVIGLGVIGHMAAKLYANAGAQTVGCDTSALRVEQAVKAGIKAVAVKGSLKETFLPFFPEGADAVIDCTGVPSLVASSMEVCRDLPWGDHSIPGARFVAQGSYPGAFSVPYNAGFMRELTILMPRSEQDKNRMSVFGMIKRSEISLQSVITDVRPPEDAPKTYSQLLDQNSGLMTVVFNWK